MTEAQDAAAFGRGWRIGVACGVVIGIAMALAWARAT